jgi:hypothetical protein
MEKLEENCQNSLKSGFKKCGIYLHNREVLNRFYNSVMAEENDVMQQGTDNTIIDHLIRKVVEATERRKMRKTVKYHVWRSISSVDVEINACKPK